MVKSIEKMTIVKLSTEYSIVKYEVHSGKSTYGTNSLAKSYASYQSENIQVKSIETCGCMKKMTEDGKLKKKTAIR